MKTSSRLALVTVALAALAGTSAAQPVESGGLLTTPDGLTLYVFDNDPAGSGRSVCNAP